MSRESDIFQPGKADFDSSSNVGAKAKISCTDITVDFDVNAFVGEYKEMLRFFVENIELFFINSAVEKSVYYYAYGKCQAQLLSFIAREYPEQGEKIKSCFTKEAGKMENSMGGQAGMWWPPGSIVILPWVNTTTESSTNPGVGLSVLGCIGDAMGDRIKDSFNTCVNTKYQDTLRLIRKFSKWEFEEKFKLEMITRQECVLDQERAENDINLLVDIKARIMPDGTKIKGRAGVAVASKVAYSTYTPDEKEEAQIFQDIDSYFEKLINANTRLDDYDVDEIFSWYKKFAVSNWKMAEHVCMDTFSQIDSNYPVYQVKLDVCGRYIESIYGLMVSKALGSPYAAAGTSIERKTASHAYRNLSLGVRQEVKRYKELQSRIERINAQIRSKQNKSLNSIENAKREIQGRE